jgi:virulence-associated protein VagC
MNKTAATPVRLGVATALALLLGACSMGSMFAPQSGSTASLQSASPTQSELQTASTNVLPAIATECPPIKVRPGSEALFYYGKGRVGNPRDLNYQAVIDKQSRNCVVSNGLITVDMGVVGRLLLGPAGTQNSVTLPVRFAVERDEVAVYSEKYDIPVTIVPPSQSGEFVQVVENVAIPYIGGENIVIWVGFDSQG